MVGDSRETGWRAAPFPTEEPCRQSYGQRQRGAMAGVLGGLGAQMNTHRMKTNRWVHILINPRRGGGELC